MSEKRRRRGVRAPGAAPVTPASPSGLYAWPTPPIGYAVTISHAQARPLWQAWQAYSATQSREQSHEQGGAAEPLRVSTSADLGLSTVEATLTESGVLYPGGERLTWEVAQRVIAAPNQCFVVDAHGGAHAIASVSPTSGLARSLMPTAGAPTTLVSGFSMHRIKGTEPWSDSVAKARDIAPLSGRMLDTTTGLGYTAILAARSAAEVVTIELDPTALEIARRNPWSHELFDRDNIQRIVGDAFAVVAEQPEASFDRIIHDPPYLALAGDLYAEEMYRRLYRALRTGGRLFHYIGDPHSASGARTTAGVIRRLEAVGFQRVTRRPEAFGLSATK